MFPMSLDCPFLVTPPVFFNVYLTSSKQYFSYIHDKNKLKVYKQYIMQVHWWHYIYIITFLVSNVPCVSGLSILHLPLRLQSSLSFICGCIMVIGIQKMYMYIGHHDIVEILLKLALNTNQSMCLLSSSLSS